MRRLQICLSLLVILILVTTCLGQLGNVNLGPLPGMQFVNRTHRLGRGLVGYWPMNERSGTTVFDLSGNGNDGLIITGGGLAPTWDAGYFGSALNFSANPARPAVEITISRNMPSATVTFFLKHNSSDRYAYLFATSSSGYAYWDDNNDTISPSSGTVYVDGIATAIMSENEWHCVSISGIALDTTGSGYLRFGNIYGALKFDQHLTGLLEFFYLHDRALSAEEIAELYKERDSWMFKRGDIELMAKSVAAPPAVVPTLYYYSSIPLVIIGYCFILGRKNE